MFRPNLSGAPLNISMRWLIFLLVVLKLSYAIKDPDVEGMVKFAVIHFSPEACIV